MKASKQPLKRQVTHTQVIYPNKTTEGSLTPVLIAFCNDGTIWWNNDDATHCNGWSPYPSIPHPKDEE